ncbi:uncharacterized protein RCO7_10852 [Rhynchosporium graminicola]|uniref:Uncharacterized protein n=1 Tax=Rhynchosporium graminicola TaxID=2792576 RepID=A0A1E1LT01_9HELO|nr:uncharacterized protein RCO7_10852 [Rhynchosporium commune]
MSQDVAEQLLNLMTADEIEEKLDRIEEQLQILTTINESHETQEELAKIARSIQYLGAKMEMTNVGLDIKTDLETSVSDLIVVACNMLVGREEDVLKWINDTVEGWTEIKKKWDELLRENQHNPSDTTDDMCDASRGKINIRILRAQASPTLPQRPVIPIPRRPISPDVHSPPLRCQDYTSTLPRIGEQDEGDEDFVNSADESRGRSINRQAVNSHYESTILSPKRPNTTGSDRSSQAEKTRIDGMWL